MKDHEPTYDLYWHGFLGSNVFCRSNILRSDAAKCNQRPRKRSVCPRGVYICQIGSFYTPLPGKFSCFSNFFSLPPPPPPFLLLFFWFESEADFCVEANLRRNKADHLAATS